MTVVANLMSVCYILCSYYILKNIYNVNVKAEIERDENNILLNMIDEGLLIVTRDTKRNILFYNDAFL